jgi:hypothetical protein
VRASLGAADARARLLTVRVAFNAPRAFGRVCVPGLTRGGCCVGACYPFVADSGENRCTRPPPPFPESKETLLPITHIIPHTWLTPWRPLAPPQEPCTRHRRPRRRREPRGRPLRATAATRPPGRPAAVVYRPSHAARRPGAADAVRGYGGSSRLWRRQCLQTQSKHHLLAACLGLIGAVPRQLSRRQWRGFGIGQRAKAPSRYIALPRTTGKGVQRARADVFGFRTAKHRQTRRPR